MQLNAGSSPAVVHIHQATTLDEGVVMQSISRKAFTEAMMLLEMGWQGLNPEYGTAEDYALAAHSLLQVASGGDPSWDGAEVMLTKIKAASAEGACGMALPSKPAAQKINAAQAKTISALGHIEGLGGADAIENHGGNMSSASKLAADGLLIRRRIVAKSGYDIFEYRRNDASHDALIA